MIIKRKLLRDGHYAKTGSGHNFTIGLLKTESAVRTVTTRINSSFPACVWMTHPRSHLEGGKQSSIINMRDPILISWDVAILRSPEVSGGTRETIVVKIDPLFDVEVAIWKVGW